MPTSRWTRTCATVASAAIGVALLTAQSPAGARVASAGATSGRTSGSNACGLANGIKHVINIQFDNVHQTRDNPNVPSDLEQMPHSTNFLKQNGVMLANTHDVLVHTATNFISNQTGLYPDRTGITQSNSYNYYAPTGATLTAPRPSPTGQTPVSSFDGDTSDTDLQHDLHREPVGTSRARPT